MSFEDEMREKFRSLGTRAAEIRAVSTPLRSRRDTMIAEHQAAIKVVEDQIRAAEAGLFELDNERAMIARALKGRT